MLICAQIHLKNTGEDAFLDTLTPVGNSLYVDKNVMANLTGDVQLCGASFSRQIKRVSTCSDVM